ncbi:hypothetical protein ACWEF6_16010 [Amycolatopsis sp. NPDC004772]
MTLGLRAFRRACMHWWWWLREHGIVGLAGTATLLVVTGMVVSSVTGTPVTLVWAGEIAAVKTALAVNRYVVGTARRRRLR